MLLCCYTVYLSYISNTQNNRLRCSVAIISDLVSVFVLFINELCYRRYQCLLFTGVPPGIESLKSIEKKLALKWHNFFPVALKSIKFFNVYQKELWLQSAALQFVHQKLQSSCSTRSSLFYHISHKYINFKTS